MELILEEVYQWRGSDEIIWENRYDKVSPTTKLLLGFWFEETHILPNGDNFEFYPAQRDAIETLIYLWEVLELKTTTDIFIYLSKRQKLKTQYIPSPDLFPRMCFKMATGSGKTFIMALAIVWSYFNSILEKKESITFFKNFLIIAPNLIVLDRLASDIKPINDSESIFSRFPFIPPYLKNEFKINIHNKGDFRFDGKNPTIYLTNIQDLYPKAIKKTPIDLAGDYFTSNYLLSKDELEELMDSSNPLIANFRKLNNLMVINDEAHHAHDESLWFQMIESINRGIMEKNGNQILQLDFSATPRYVKVQTNFFPHIIYDFPLHKAIKANIVKKPIIGNLANVQEIITDDFAEKRRFQIETGLKIREEYEEILNQLGKNAILFIVADKNKNADLVERYIKRHFPKYKNSILLIHTYEQGTRKGEVKDTDLERLRKEARDIDKSNKYKIIISVMMLKEGWDVKSVVTIVPLRSFDSQILVEQTLGRGLRKMFNQTHIERLTVIEHFKFKQLHESLRKESLEDTIDIVEIGIENFEALTSGQIVICPDRVQYNLEIPVLVGGYYTTELKNGSLNIHELPTKVIKISDIEVKDVKYYEKEFGKDEIIREMIMHFKFYNNINTYTVLLAKSIFRKIKLNPNYPLWEFIRNYLQYYFFDIEIDFNDEEIIRKINHPIVYKKVYEILTTKITEIIKEEKDYIFSQKTFSLIETPPFITSKKVEKVNKTVLNFTPFDSELEKEFAQILENDDDILSFCKILPQMKFYIYYYNNNGFLKRYIPDFFVRTTLDNYYIVEMKGSPYLEMMDTKLKKNAAIRWCKSVTRLSNKKWTYLLITKATFEKNKGLIFKKFVENVLAEMESL